jgi:hypothetical protein
MPSHNVYYVKYFIKRVNEAEEFLSVTGIFGDPFVLFGNTPSRKETPVSVQPAGSPARASASHLGQFSDTILVASARSRVHASAPGLRILTRGFLVIVGAEATFLW